MMHIKLYFLHSRFPNEEFILKMVNVFFVLIFGWELNRLLYLRVDSLKISIFICPEMSIFEQIKLLTPANYKM